MRYPDEPIQIGVGILAIVISVYFFVSGYSATSLEATIGFGIVVVLLIIMVSLPVLDQRRQSGLVKRIRQK